jgi:hypothetical protein
MMAMLDGVDGVQVERDQSYLAGRCDSSRRQEALDFKYPKVQGPSVTLAAKTLVRNHSLSALNTPSSPGGGLRKSSRPTLSGQE